MVLDSKIDAVREAYGIRDISDWSDITPAQVLAVDGVGPVSLDHIRLYLASKSFTLKDDRTPTYWREHLSEARMCRQMGIDDSCEVSPFEIAIDTGEQTPFDFLSLKHQPAKGKAPLIVPTLRKHLAFAGHRQSYDYSIVGLESQICVERKSLEDLYGTLGRDHDEFEFKLRLMATPPFEIALIVVEQDWATIATRPPPQSKVPPEAIVGSIVAWQQRIPQVHWLLMPGRVAAERMAYRQMERFWRDVQATMDNWESRERKGAAKVDAGSPLLF